MGIFIDQKCRVEPFPEDYYTEGYVTLEDRAEKVREEAAEVVGAVDYYQRLLDKLKESGETDLNKAIGNSMLEIGLECMDVLQAVVNLLDALGLYDNSSICGTLYEQVALKNRLRRDPDIISMRVGETYEQ